MLFPTYKFKKIGFRPLSGIIYFNYILAFGVVAFVKKSFRPLSGIIYFNNSKISNLSSRLIFL